VPAPLRSPPGIQPPSTVRRPRLRQRAPRMGGRIESVSGPGVAVSERSFARAPPARYAFPMLVVQKYGGTSVADAERILHVARRVQARLQQGDEVVVVVSAMGNRTDELIDLAMSI